MPKYLLNDIPAKTIAPGYDAKLIHTENMTFSFVTVTAGSVLPEHSHKHEQVSQLVSGSFELTVAGEVHAMQANELIVIPPHVLHSGRAITDCVLLDTFSPVREDYRDLK